MTKIEIEQMRVEQAERLEYLLSNSNEIEEIAKKMYPKNWKVIYSGENHPHNKSSYKL